MLYRDEKDFLCESIFPLYRHGKISYILFIGGQVADNRGKKMSKFVVLNPQGEVLKSNASAKEAAEVVLGYDGHEWEIRPGHHNIGYTLFVSKFSRNSACYDSRLIEIVHANGNSMEEIEEKNLSRGLSRTIYLERMHDHRTRTI